MLDFFSTRYTSVSRYFQILLASLVFLDGALTVIFPIPAIYGAIGAGFSYLYGIMLMVGSAGVLWGILKPNYKIELGFLWLIAGGWLIYDLSIWAIYVDRVLHPGISDQPPPYGSGISVLCLTIFYAWRIAYLSVEVRKLLKAAKSVGSS